MHPDHPLPPDEPAPQTAADRLVAFMNSHGVGFDAGRDLLAAPPAQDSTALGYQATPFPAGAALAQARALRGLLLDGVTADGVLALSELNAIAAALPWRFVFDADGVAKAVPQQEGLAARVLADLAACAAAGQWRRIKVCANPACGALFYDSTKARTRRWHSFELCGNKANVAAHRGRKLPGG